MAATPRRRPPRRAAARRRIATAAAIGLASVATVTLALVVPGSPANAPEPPPAAASDVVELRPTLEPTKSAPPTPDPLHGQGPTDVERALVDDPSSNLVVVNKRRPVQPLDFQPATVAIPGGLRLRPEAAVALAGLEAAAAADGVAMHASSAYRSYADQVSTYQRWQAQMGGGRADALSARPGYSEHQTGLAVDMRPETGTCRAYSTCFGSTPQALWLTQHAVEHGFVVRYEAAQSATTGYDAEPWHLRYVGTDVARRYAASGAHSLEEWFGLPPAPTY